MVKVAVIFTIATFLINQGIEAMVIAEFIPVWTLQLSLLGTAIIFPFVMYIAYVIIYKNDEEEPISYENQVLNQWLLIFSGLVLIYAIFERFHLH